MAGEEVTSGSHASGQSGRGFVAGCTGLSAVFRLLLGFVALALLPAQNSMALPSAADCRAGVENVAFKADLTAMKAKLSRGEQAVIIALGSSSTAGAGATSKDMSYPAILESELKRRLPDLDIRVVNRGVGGHRARDMLARLESDVISERPDLVIWQTGGNDAIHDVGIEKFKKYTRKGVARMMESGANVLMMDSQWLPKAERYPNYMVYQMAVAEVARETGVGLFRRYDVMKAWAQAGRLSPADIIGTDGLHMVDGSYYCLGLLLADGIARELSMRLGQSAPLWPKAQ